jgi:hypothetical protein
MTRDACLHRRNPVLLRQVSSEHMTDVRLASVKDILPVQHRCNHDRMRGTTPVRQCRNSRGVDQPSRHGSGQAGILVTL